MPTSSCIKRHGGKAYLAKKIRALFPPHTRYCEPYFGSGAVLFSGDGDGVAEFVNDLDRQLIDFWMVLRDTPDRLLRKLWATPLGRWFFEEAAENLKSDDRVQRATAFFVRNRQSRQGLGKDYCTPTSRLRRGMNEQVSAWLSAVDGLSEFHQRLRRVEIRCQDAQEFIAELDSPDTLFYCDPPYMHETRVVLDAYGEHEMDQRSHASLLGQLATIQGKFVLSGYANPLYDGWEKQEGWRRVDFEIDNKASSAKDKPRKIESLWMNYEA